jgi:hypothetical protein
MVAITDEYGCEFAVVGLRGAVDFVVFPSNFVTKRWERKEAGFYAAASLKIAQKHAKYRADWEGGSQASGGPNAH